MSTETESTVVAPKNEFGYYEIRMESIGGQGANLASKILADVAIVDMGLNGISFASYGSEKKGTPVKAFIRLADPEDEIRINSPVIEPHLLVIFSTVLAKGVEHVWDTYGCSEVGQVAIGCRAGELHVVEELVKVDQDEEGKLLLSTVGREGTQFEEYEVGDTAELVEGRCECGSDVVRLRNVLRYKDEERILCGC